MLSNTLSLARGGGIDIKRRQRGNSTVIPTSRGIPASTVHVEQLSRPERIVCRGMKRDVVFSLKPSPSRRAGNRFKKTKWILISASKKATSSAVGTRYDLRPWNQFRPWNVPAKPRNISAHSYAAATLLPWSRPVLLHTVRCGEKKKKHHSPRNPCPPNTPSPRKLQPPIPRFPSR